MKPIELPGCVTMGTRESWATLSSCGRYRYALGRAWDPAPEGEWDGVRATFSIVMLNPSTADHSIDDPTIKKCIHFAKQEGCGSLLVRNLFAWRTTHPKELHQVEDPWGPLNERVLELDPFFAMCVAAWGALTPKWLRQKASRSTGIVKMARSLHVLGLTKHGYDQSSHFSSMTTRQPRHPLYLPNATRAVLWSKAQEASSV